MRETFFWMMSPKNEFPSTTKNPAFLGPKGAILGNQGHKTARRAAEWAPTGKLNVFKVTLGYG